MPNDEQLIRDVVVRWQTATAEVDLATVLSLMAEDVAFLTPGQPPMRGREAFAANFKKATEKFHIKSSADIQEIHVTGDWAYCLTHLSMEMMPVSEGSQLRRSGYTLSVFRKNSDGSWVLYRDANLVAPEQSTVE